MYIFPIFFFFFRKISTEESLGNDTVAMELEKTDMDLRELPFRFPVAVAKEIDASLDSHPPIKYLLTPTEVSGTDYTKISPTVNEIDSI